MSDSKPATFASFQAELSRLVAQFEKNLNHYKSGTYDEASLRNEFLNPFFRALGWDVENKAGHIPKDREVELESRTEIAGQMKFADYLFRIDRNDRFVCEAKKPAERIDQPRHIFQAKRYAWNKGTPIAVLTDFEDWKFYVVGSRPHMDEPNLGHWESFHFKELILNAQFFWDMFARENVAAGCHEKFLETLPKTAKGKGGKAKQLHLIKPDRSRALDVEFLNLLDKARQELGSDLLKHNDRAELLEGTNLNDAIQRIIDRILFLRICEDREIDTGRKLTTIIGRDRETKTKATQPPLMIREESAMEYDAGGGGGKAPPAEGRLWRAMVRHFRNLDRDPLAPGVPFFNGNLFKKHFSDSLTVGDEWLFNFVSDLSSDESPYLFNVIPVEILGTIYERFLGKIVRPQGRGTLLEEKPEVRKAGGVYYTPRYIVDYIVEQTVGKLLDGKEPNESLKLRILDPACGSGSFLIRAFERVCEHWQRWLTKHPDKRKDAWCWTDPVTHDVHLTSTLKARILTSTIYGVDLDGGAVEVSQLSLYLKMLEGESRTSLQRERELFGSDTPLLPPLENNIKRGNSLIASDFSLDPDDLVRVHAFDWNIGFKDIMKSGGFDAVVGNPPYIRIQGFPQDQIAYFSAAYRAATGNYDIYVNFVEKALQLLNPAGRFGMILPNKFFRTDYGIGLRTVLSEATAVNRIVDFGSEQVFEATTYTCLLFLVREPAPTFTVAETKADAKALAAVEFESKPASSLGVDAWTFANAHESRLLAKLNTVSKRLLDLPAEMSRGSSSGDDEIFVVAATDHKLEAGALRVPLYATDFGRYYIEPSAEWRIIFPYEVFDGGSRLMDGSEIQRKFPKAFAYLKSHDAELRKRKQFAEWYGYSAPRNLELHTKAQIAVPLLANGPTFAFIPKGERNKLCPMASGGFTISISEKCGLKPEFVLGVLNSKLLFWCLRQVSNVFRGGWITCTKQYFGELPIRAIDLKKPAEKARHDKLVGLVDKMLVLMPKLRAAKTDAEKATLQNAVDKTDQDIDALVYELYGLTPEEIALVEGPSTPLGAGGE